MIFEIIERHKIPSPLNGEKILLDETLDEFLEEYRGYCNARDIEVYTSLSSTRKFRSFIPFTKNCFNIANEILWYYDELIIFDPILKVTSRKYQNMEQLKQALFEIIRILYSFKDAIENGFIILITDPRDEAFFTQIDSAYSSLKANDQIMRHLKDSATYKVGNNSLDGSDVIVSSVSIGNQENAGIQLKKVTRSFALPLSLITNTVMIDCSASDFLDKVDMASSIIDQQLIDLATRELKWLYGNLGFSKLINSPLVVRNDIHNNVLQIGNSINQTRESKTFNMLLPFIKNIPPEKLMDVRSHIPEIFENFRFRVLEIVEDLQQDIDLPDTEIEYRFQSIMNKDFLVLEKEMKAQLFKSKVLGIGIPIISGLGALILSRTSIDISKLVTPLMGSGALSLKVAADYYHHNLKSQSNPLYYLWKVQK